MDLEQLIDRAKQGDLDAFAEVTRRFQHMAFGYALSIVRDLQQAEDVVQEAFVAAWFGLITLADPAAFPGWFRGIVRHQSHRVIRQRHLEALPLAAADAVAAEETRPDDRLEQGQQVAAVLDAIARLPAPLREIVTLFYVHDCTQQDIATFLGLPVTTVNNRLHAARTQLKRRTLTMVKDTLEAHRLPDDFAARIGRIVRAREGVVEVLFDPTKLPDPLTELTVSDEGRRRGVAVQVVQLLENGVVRCVPMSPIEALSPGMTVLSSGRRAEAQVSREVLDGAVRLLAGPAREPGRPAELLETGIKVIDVMCPLVRGGTVAIAGEYAAGPMVVTEELCRRLHEKPGGVSIFTFIPPGPGLSFQEVWAKESFTGGTAGTVQTFYFVGEEAWTVERLSASADCRCRDSPVAGAGAARHLPPDRRDHLPVPFAGRQARRPGARGGRRPGSRGIGGGRGCRAPRRRIFRLKGRASFCAFSLSHSSWPSPTRSCPACTCLARRPSAGAGRS